MFGLKTCNPYRGTSVSFNGYLSTAIRLSFNGWWIPHIYRPYPSWGILPDPAHNILLAGGCLTFTVYIRRGVRVFQYLSTAGGYLNLTVRTCRSVFCHIIQRLAGGSQEHSLPNLRLVGVCNSLWQ